MAKVIIKGKRRCRIRRSRKFPDHWIFQPIPRPRYTRSRLTIIKAYRERYMPDMPDLHEGLKTLLE